MKNDDPNSIYGYTISPSDKVEIESLLSKIEDASDDIEHMMVVSLDEICGLLTAEERAQVKRVYNINPEFYGFKKPRAGMEPVPKNLVKVKPQPYIYEGQEYFTPMQYVPAGAYKAYQLMAKAMEKKIGRKLLIESSYRSNASQAINFLAILKLNDYDLEPTIQRVAVPAYSEHGTPSMLAFDFKNTDGLPSYENPEDFATTEEYKWLTSNAFKYDFYLTYTEDNTYGVMFEPWHWRHVPPK